MTAKEIEEGHISSDRWPLVSHFTQKFWLYVCGTLTSQVGENLKKKKTLSTSGFYWV